MIRTLLLTGATGFIGSHLTKRLLDKDYKVVILKRSTSDLWRIQECIDQYGTELVMYDIDVDDVEIAFKEHTIDCVMHLATHYVKANESEEDMEDMRETNVRMPTRLAEAAVAHGVKCFVNTGTFFEYQMKDEPIVECDIIDPYNFYAQTKVDFNQILQGYAGNGSLKVMDFKLFAPYGEKDRGKVMVFLINSLLKGDHIDFSGGEQQWNFTYVRDIVEAYVYALRYFEKDFTYESFNIGNNEVHSLKECVSTLEKVSGLKFDITFGARPYSDNEIFYANCDNSKAREILGWSPQYSLESGLKLMYDHVKNNQ